MKFKALTVNLMVHDVQRSADFYALQFGFETGLTLPGEDGLTFAIIKRDEVTIMLQSMKSFVEGLPQYANTPIGGSVLLYIDVEDVNGVYEKAHANGAEIVVDMHKTFYGTREFTVKDCDGYLVSFAEDVAE
jgi:lactoylglutathione lyase